MKQVCSNKLISSLDAIDRHAIYASKAYCDLIYKLCNAREYNKDKDEEFQWILLNDTFSYQPNKFDTIREACDWLLDKGYKVFCFEDIKEFASWVIKQY